MAKNIAEPTRSQFALMASVAQKVVAPESYFRGHLAGAVSLPDNVLLFSRCRGESLQHFNGEHFHHRHLLIVPLAGRGRVMVNARPFALEPGLCLLVSPYQFHHYSQVDSGEIVWLFLTFEQAAAVVMPDEPSAFVAGCQSQFWNDLTAFVETYRLKPSAERNMQLVCRLALLLAQTRAGQRQSEGGVKVSASERFLQRLHQLVMANIAHPLSVDELGRKMGLSGSYLRSRFRKLTGGSLGTFQRVLRLQHAASLLASGSNVSEAAARCGWESAFSFSRAFTAYWKQPPKQFSMRTRAG